MEKVKKAKVTKRGVLIPREFFQGVEEVEITKQKRQVVVRPAGDSDPILDLGRNPVETGVSDGAEKHDQFIYGQSGS